MTEVLKCPECSAPLRFPPNGGPTMQCPYCNNTVLLPAASASSEKAPAMVQRPVELAEIIKLIQAGNKIGAIKVYRQIFGVDLMTAKNAVEKHAAGQQVGTGAALMVSYASPAAGQATNFALKLGCGVALSVLFMVGLILFFVSRSVHQQIAKTRTALSSTTISPMPVFPTSPTRKANSANAIILPTFAHVAMEFGSEGIGAGQFKDARSIAIDGDRMIYVGEYTGGRVQVFDPKGKFVTVWSIAKDNALLNLTADRKGNVYAVVPSHIYRHKGATGELLGEVDHETDDTPSIYYSDAFVALDGDLYAIGNDHLIVDITPDGKIKRTLNAMEKVGENVSFDRITVNGAGEIYAVDREKGVFKFSPEGRYINRFGGGAAGNVRGPGHLSSPRGVAVDGKGRVCVTDNFKAVQVFDGDGIYLDSFGDDLAFGIAINDQNEILACFRNRNCVRKYVLDKP